MSLYLALRNTMMALGIYLAIVSAYCLFKGEE
jgi:hypothetical protein